MISSCNDCTNKCCRSGPGPYKKVTANEWLFEVQGSDKYNSSCEHFREDSGLCAAWGTGKLPMVCRTYVCGSRTYSEEELEQIDYWLRKVSK